MKQNELSTNYTWYKVTTYWHNIEKVTVNKVTDKSLLLSSGRMVRINSSHDKYFPSFDKAKAFLIEKYESNLAQLDRKSQQTKSVLEELRSKFILENPKQCITCPFREESTCADIPNYEEEWHESLWDTVSDGTYNPYQKEIKNMACHYSIEGKPRHCIGWLHHQLGRGNNIALRIKFMKCQNANEIEVIGEQVENFEETFK